MNLRFTCPVVLALVALSPVITHAQDFSADVVYAEKPAASFTAKAPSADATTAQHPPSRLYVSKDKMRLETRGFTGTVLLVNGEERTTVALFPIKKAYQPLVSGPPQYFRVTDPDNACPDWQKAVTSKIACQKVGPETVGGRETVKYQNKNVSDGAPTAVWIDKNLKLVLKWEDSDTGAELHNIKEGQQSADLFTVPSTYKLLEPQKASPKGFSKKPK
jgi:hypothetical protein